MLDRAEERQGVLQPALLSGGTTVSQNLQATRRFYEEFFGFECADYAPGAMLVRDRDPKSLRQRAGKPYWVMDVREQPGAWKTNLFKHWGIDVASEAEVARVYEIALASQQRFGFKTIRKPRMQHGTFSFYIEDADGNWWEVECRPPGDDNDTIFAGGGRPL